MDFLLIALFVSRGVSSMLPLLGVRSSCRSWLAAKPVHVADPNPFSGQRMLGGFSHTRIIVMHLTLIFGGIVAGAVGSVVPLVLMIALKIAIELKLHLKNDSPADSPRRRPAV